MKIANDQKEIILENTITKNNDISELVKQKTDRNTALNRGNHTKELSMFILALICDGNIAQIDSVSPALISICCHVEKNVDIVLVILYIDYVPYQLLFIMHIKNIIIL